MRSCTLYIIGVCLLTSCMWHTPKPASEAPEKVIRQWLDSAESRLDNHDLKGAIKFLNRAEAAEGNIKNDSVGFRLCRDMALLHERSGSLKLALGYQERALKYAKATKKGGFIVDIFNRQVYTLYKMGCNDSAWNVTQEVLLHYPRASKEQRVLMLQHAAYHKMLVDSIDEATLLLVRAYRNDADSMATVPDSATLRAIYGRMPLENMMLEDLLTIQNQMDRAQTENEKTRMQMYFSWLVTVALLAIGGISFWYRRREQVLTDRYENLIDNIRTELEETLGRKNATIEDMKAAIDHSTKESEALREKLPKAYKGSKNSDFIERIKLGVDVLYAIERNANISQFGRKEQIAVVEVMQIIAPDLAAILTDTGLTPKEVFFCIMEYQGKGDREKAVSFCCSEQAVRSTKSRLGKKMDLGILRRT